MKDEEVVVALPMPRAVLLAVLSEYSLDIVLATAFQCSLFSGIHRSLQSIQSFIGSVYLSTVPQCSLPIIHCSQQRDRWASRPPAARISLLMMGIRYAAPSVLPEPVEMCKQHGFRERRISSPVYAGTELPVKAVGQIVVVKPVD